MNTSSALSLENVRELVGDLPHDLLITSRLHRLLAEDSSEDFHQVERAMLMLGVVRVAQDAAAQFEIPFAELDTGWKEI